MQDRQKAQLKVLFACINDKVINKISLCNDECNDSRAMKMEEKSVFILDTNLLKL